MANIFLSENLDKDYVAFEKAIFKTNKIKYKLESKVKPHLKKYHRLTYIVALFETKLEEKWKEDNRFLFLNEILSDLLSNSSLCFIGFYHPSQIIVRRLIENFYHHIFYFEHIVEYTLLNLGNNDYIPIVDLKRYLEAHPTIKKTEDLNIKNFNDDLFSHYQELCRTVHTKGTNFMGLAKNLEEIKPDFDLSEHLEKINKSVGYIIYLLFKFHRDLIFTQTERDIIAKAFVKNIRGQLFA